ncbi:RNA binding protein-like protein [Cucurbitaria berberidis CBS 394.84]|uniref:RNA binding protein-like protein n=1 Tax=Cucurbitaria berberidis CBS 394.84 TaxID=1168544 RepID=A0A9P4L3D9_9PLEO|nr:RNA binding protein-like protein [Cucurbitaria berberidis CBS 394.84]KAF1840202.1 RNA binding protein-like protein [Cucurbitaria berberidis CBS 394.84]
MAGGPSPTSTSPSNLSNSPFLHGSISSSTSSSPPKPFSSQNTMTADVFAASHAYGMPAAFGERRPMEKNGLSLLSFSDAETLPELKPGRHTIFLRKLPSNSDRDAVRNILLFAKDLVDCELVSHSRLSEDKGFASAVAHFQTYEGAKEARDLLNGKRNATNDATLVVELLQDGLPGAIGSRRNTVDSSASTRQGSIASGIATTNNGRQSSRYNGTFQNMEKMSPPNGTPGLGNGEFPTTNLFSPTSPVNTSFTSRNLGKSVINDEADDVDGLLNESIGYGTGGPPVQSNMQRRATNPNPPIPVSRFASLSLNTNGVNGMTSPPLPNYASPRSGSNMQSPGATMSAMSPHTIPSALSNASNTGFQQYSQHFARPTYPPVNPADQNPPCNTLYVGNLPMDTSEDELKAVFSKQRGYKRLCFRTKQNGPMCFVEFEDTSFATKALNELYGYMLHNSVKGGIRLSFSKNPLGVRSGQGSSMGPPSAITPSTPLSGFGNNVVAPPGFSTATGPPPGLSAPPGLSTPVHHHHHNNNNGNSGFGMYSNGGFGMGPNDMASPMRQPLATSVAGNGFGGMGGSYTAYMMGR